MHVRPRRHFFPLFCNHHKQSSPAVVSFLRGGGGQKMETLSNTLRSFFFHGSATIRTSAYALKMRETRTKAIPPLLLLLQLVLCAVGNDLDEPLVNPNADALLDLLNERSHKLTSPFVENDILCHCTDYGCDEELKTILGAAGKGMCRAKGGVCKKTVSLVVVHDGEPPTVLTSHECVPPEKLQPSGRPFTCHASIKQQDRINVQCCKKHFCSDNITLELLPHEGPLDDYGFNDARRGETETSSYGMLFILSVCITFAVACSIIAVVCTRYMPNIVSGIRASWRNLAKRFRVLRAKMHRYKEKKIEKAEKSSIVKLEDGVIDPELEKLDNKEAPPPRPQYDDSSFPFLSADYSSKLSGSSLAGAFFDLQEELVNKFADQNDITAQLEEHVMKVDGKPNNLLKLLDDLDSASSAVYSTSESSEGNSGKSTGVPVNLQRSFASQIEVKRDEYLGGGRFGTVYKGYWRGDYFAIKTMDTKDHFSWARETEIYNTNMLRHNNLLRFIASYTYDAGYYMENWIITEYHEKGDLSDHLSNYTVTRDIGLRMIRGLASGLSYLHLPIIGHRAEGKPAIAHRDLKSKNVLVKNDFSVCIADLGLSVKYDATMNCIDGETQRKCGTPRYLAPELLDDSINLANFDAFCLSDVYSLSLIFWEIVNRMEDSHDPPKFVPAQYELPYYEHVPREPTEGDLLRVVCQHQLRPQFLNAWVQDEVLYPLLSLISDMWSPRAVNRPTPERVRILVDGVIAAEEQRKAALSANRVGPISC